MPMYDFFCRNCRASFEELLLKEEDAPQCPHCASTDTERRISMPSPLKKGAFPFKPGPVHPIAARAGGGCGGSCPSGGFS